MTSSPFKVAAILGSTALAGVLAVSGGAASGEAARGAATAPADFAQMCSVDAVKAVAAALPTAKVAPGRIANQPGPFLPGGVQFTPAKVGMPAYCQVTGSYVTNAAAGRTANFLATFPENWNGKYLQIGCAGHCGTFAVSNPAMFTITITNQGKPGDIIRKGYAAFATDQGHTSMAGGSWAVEGPGKVNAEAIEDFYIRASRVLTRVGKEFTRAFYATRTQGKARIARSYFSGCSGGGRDALVAASNFPEEFDGIIAGSPYNLMGTSMFVAGASLATLRAPDAFVPPKLAALVGETVTRQCDAIDGVRDGLIQNPAACNFLPERDLPLCEPGKSGDACFTRAQIETVGTTLTALTDEFGKVVQPGYSVSDYAIPFPAPPADPAAADPWGENPAAVLWPLGNASIKVFTHKNDPGFFTRSIYSFRDGGPGGIDGFRLVVPRAEVDRIMAAGRRGTGHYPENFAPLIKRNGKLLIWHNLSDEKLTPFMSFELYKALAARFGGYGKLQRNVRMFGLPGTAHCSGGGQPVGPGSFDPLTAMENWVEKGIAPNALTATLYQPTPIAMDYAKPLGRTMPLCMFPQMARYKGAGAVNDGASWECRADDRRMLQLGESGRRAGLSQ